MFASLSQLGLFSGNGRVRVGVSGCISLLYSSSTAKSSAVRPAPVGFGFPISSINPNARSSRSLKYLPNSWASTIRVLPVETIDSAPVPPALILGILLNGSNGFFIITNASIPPEIILWIIPSSG